MGNIEQEKGRNTLKKGKQGGKEKAGERKREKGKRGEGKDRKKRE